MASVPANLDSTLIMARVAPPEKKGSTLSSMTATDDSLKPTGRRGESLTETDSSDQGSTYYKNDSDGIVSSLTNDSKQNGKQVNQRSEESSEDSFSSLSGEDQDKKKKKRKFKAVSDTSCSSSSNLRHKKAKDELSGIVTLDLTTPEGQMAANPTMSEEAAKTAAKREYNRRNAARARLRNKEMVSDLQKKVSDLTSHTQELQRSNEVLRAQLDVLAAQNRNLVLSRDSQQQQQQQQAPSAPPAPPTAMDQGLAGLLGLLQGQLAQQQQPAPPVQAPPPPPPAVEQNPLLAQLQALLQASSSLPPSETSRSQPSASTPAPSAPSVSSSSVSSAGAPAAAAPPSAPTSDDLLAMLRQQLGQAPPQAPPPPPPPPQEPANPFAGLNPQALLALLRDQQQQQQSRRPSS